MDSTVDPLDTQTEGVRGAALTALRGWAARRDRLADDRADLMAAAWWSGTRTVAELARTADVSRDTVYDDLRARGIEPTDKNAAPPDRLPPYAPLNGEVVRELARQANALVRPAMLTDRPGWLLSAAWHLTIVLDRIGALADPAAGIDPDRRAAHAQDLAARLGMTLHFVHQAWDELASDRELAAWSRGRTDNALGQGEMVVGRAEVTLIDPDTGSPLTVQIGTAGTGSRPGFTVLRADTPLPLDVDVDGVDHLAIQTALQSIGRVLNGRRDPGADTFDADEVEAAE
ncbi:hypothetical protein [Streptomyces sp. HYC2]|uniref:hypothetical protein n=1 Tax=Streptomyces sp. HYC2 TaxID=2955207 RepID=UPI00247FD7CE|nr:hypothetical protein [Streptomyces sp. HYC2]